jgi:hypothetical protein
MLSGLHHTTKADAEVSINFVGSPWGIRLKMANAGWEYMVQKQVRTLP